MLEKIEKTVFTTVEALSGWCKPVYVRERMDKSSFNLRGGAVKHVEACVGARAYRKSSFHRCGGPVMVVQPCL